MRNRMGSSLNLDTTVVGLQGFPISTTPPSSGQALVFDGTDWVPSDVAAGGHFVPQLDPTNDVAVSSLGGPGGGPLISAFENPVSPDADFLAIRTQRDVDGTAIFLRGPTFPDPSAANGLQMWLGDGGNLLFNFTNTGQLNLPAMPVNPMDATPRQYVDSALASLPPPAAVGSTPPSNPTNGQLWWDTVSGQLFIWYDDGNSSQWVVANVSVGVPGPPGADGPAGPAGPNVMPPGVTDGSDAAPGQVGEFITQTITLISGVSTATILATINLTPGDWDIGFFVTFSFSTGTTYASMRFNPYPPGIPDIILWASGGAALTATQSVTATMSTLRMSSSTSQIIALQLSGVTGGTASTSSMGRLWARRMR